MPPVLALHGFAQNRRCLGPLATALGRAGAVTTVDLPGHGGAATVETDLWGGAALLAERLTGPTIVVGYSMGGRFALHLALLAPGDVAALVLIGANPGIVDPVERGRRRARDVALADRVMQIGVDAFCDEWLALPMFAGIAPEARFLDERRTNTAAGLASSLRLAGTGSQDDLWPRLAELAPVPVLSIAGALDAAYRDTARRLAAAVGADGTSALIDGAGHAAHLEAPHATSSTVLSWLESRGLTR